MPRILLPAYILLSLLHLWAVQRQSETLILLTKPMLLSLLALWFYLQLVRPLRELFPRFILAGLLFSIGGDTFLMLVENGPRGEQFFLYGLGSFLLAQLSYLLGLVNYPGAKSGAVAQGPWRVWPFALYLGAIVAMLVGIPGALQIPVAIYATAIVGMAIAAFNLRALVPRELFLGLMAGVLLFILSDSLIALGKFRSDAVAIPHLRLLIMSTYLAAQYFIARNCARMAGGGSSK